MSHVAPRLLLSFALVAAAGSTVLAQPSATPAEPAAPVAPVAPENADWNAVSHINGQVVPVGEKNEYFYQFKRTIISANPIGWMVGFYGVSASYAVSDHVAVRGELDYISPPANDSSSYKSTATELDLGVPIYFRRTYQGAFLEPGVVARIRSHTDQYGAPINSDGSVTNPGPVTTTDTAVGPQVLVGWHWTWDSGLNIAIAAGIGRNLNYQSGQSSDDRYIPNGYVRFGYAF